MKNILFSKTDLKYTLRLLAKAPGSALLAVLVLAGGIGISIFTFTLGYTVTYKPIPLRNGESIVQICTGSSSSFCLPFKAFEFAQMRGDIDSLENIGIYIEEYVYVETDNLVKRVRTTRTEWNMFQLSETNALLGRTLQPYDQQAGAEAVAVIAYELWQTVSNGNDDIIDSVLNVDGRATKIVGVLPKGYSYPSNSRLWLPVSNELLDPIDNELELVGTFARLKDNESRKSASLEIDGLMKRIRQLYPSDPNTEYSSRTLQRIDQSDAAHANTIPLGGLDGILGLVAVTALNLLAGLIFLLACINVGTLLLARTNERLKDVSIRVALGAPRRRLLLQTMSDSIVISLTGGMLAILVAGAGLELLNLSVLSMLGPLDVRLPFWMDFHLDGSTLLAVLLFVAFTLLFTSVIPCWRIINGDFNSVMRDGTRGAVGIQSGRFSRSLVVVSIVFITLLLYVGTLVGSAALGLKQTSASIDGEYLVGATLTLDSNRYSNSERSQFFQSLNSAVIQDPAITDSLVYTDGDEVDIEANGRAENDPAKSLTLAMAGSLNTIGASLLEGRYLNEFDNAANSNSVVVSRSLAEQLWPGQSAIDQLLRINPMQQGLAAQWQRVVGVVENKVFPGQFALSPITNMVYTALDLEDTETASIMMKYENDALRAASVLSQAIRSQDSSLIFNVRVWEDQLIAMELSANFYIALVIGCGLFSFLVAIAGIYGITKNFVDLQTQEIGTRRALGATDSKISRSFMLRGSRQVITGFIIALLIASPLTYLLATSGGLPMLKVAMAGLAIVAVTIFATVILAIIYPINSILKLEPVEALRHQ